MAWFAWQSVLFIGLGFVLGALVGYWFWRIQWHRVAFTESEAVTVISRRHERELSEKDAEIGRLQSLLAGGAAAGSATALDGDDTDVVTDAAVDPSVDTSADLSTDVSTDTSTDAVDVEDDPELLAELDMVTVGEAAEQADAEPTDAEPVTVVELPASDDVPAAEVVDVTDDAVAAAQDGPADTDDDADRGAVAHALSQLPTQSTGEDGVVDLAAVEDGAQDATAADDAAGDAPADDAPAEDGTGTPDAAPEVVPVPLADLTAAEADEEAAADGAEDDLERIEGIGPRIASALRTAGIRSFRKLADADVPTLQAALENAGLRFAPSLPTWSRQARFLADGDEVGFIKLTESLVAGREPGRSR